MKRHTDREFEHELADLRERILHMGARVEGIVASSVRAFLEGDAELARRTMDQDGLINKLEVEIDRDALAILARRQPVASDLRFLTTALKLVTDLERVGDIAVNICERATDAATAPLRRDDPLIRLMAETVQGMLRDALDAFVQADVAKARWVIEEDRGVDAAYVQVFREVLGAMTADPAHVQGGMAVQAVAKYLERIGDHATNLAEQVVFLAHGEDIRHTVRTNGP